MVGLNIMSAVSSPAHRISGDYDGAIIYDPNFTAEISNKMRVPHKLFVTGEGKNSGNDILSSNNMILDRRDAMDKSSMQVPERIVVAGQERHVGQKAPPRELRLEQVIHVPSTQHIRVETPPRVLSLEDHFFPTVNDGEEESPENENGQNFGSEVTQYEKLHKIPETPSGGTLDTSISPSGELEQLRRQLLKLNRRVLLLEQEGQLRQQRDTILYSLSIAYIVVKTLMWINRNW